MVCPLKSRNASPFLKAWGIRFSICSAYAWADLPVPALEFDRQQVSMMNHNLFSSGIDGIRDERELESAFQHGVRELKKETPGRA